MRSYQDGCAVAHALDFIGERWAPLVVRELLLGPKRFTDLRAGPPGVSPNVLAQRLRELEGAGIVRRRKLPRPAASRVYELTEWGKELEQVIISLGRWGARSPSKPCEAALVYERHDLAAALRSGDVKIEGDESAVARFLTLFPLPEPAATAVGA